MSATHVSTSTCRDPFDVLTSSSNSLTGEAMQCALDSQDYAKMLEIIRAKPDTLEKLEWLRDHSNVPFVLSERSLVELKIDPTEDTLYKVSLPVVFFEGTRMEMDMLCWNDPTLFTCKKLAHKVYFTSLTKLIDNYDLALTMPSDRKIELWQAGLALCKNLKRELEENREPLPSPIWLRNANLGRSNIVPSTEEVSMKPEEEWLPIRLSVLHKHISLLEGKIKSEQSIKA